MPPKAAADKKGKKGATKAVAKTLDPSEFIRVNTPVADVGNIISIIKLSGNVKNIETLFPDWTVDNEAWKDPIPDDLIPNISYFHHLEISGEKSIRDILGLNAELNTDSRAKTPKKESKKAIGKEVSQDFIESTVDAAGRALPQVFIESESVKYTDYKMPRGYLTSLNIKSSNATESRHDNILCSVFDYISKFAPSFFNPNFDQSSIQNKNDNMKYLWRAIYPQLPSGKPCYNPSGRYCVRLYFAGKWRKVYVNDKIPLNSDGKCGVAASEDPLELWPTILAKAIYSLFQACGYNDLISDISSDEIGTTKKAAAFAGFAIHVLSGWHPASPWSLPSVFNQKTDNCFKLIQEIIGNGTPSINKADIPGSEPRLQFEEIIESTEIIDGKVVMKTKKQFKEDYQKMLTQRDLKLKERSLRESQIMNIQKILINPFSECSLVSYLDKSTNEIKLYPILGLCLPAVSVSENIKDISVLIEWQVFPLEDSEDSNDSLESHKAANLTGSKIEFPPLPRSTPVNFKWVTIAELIDQNAFIISFDTLLKTQFKTPLGWHWLPSSAAVMQASTSSKGGGKASSKAAAAAAAVPNNSFADTVCDDPGEIPIVMISLDTTDFFKNNELSSPEDIEMAIAEQSHAMSQIKLQNTNTNAIDPANTDEVKLLQNQLKPQTLSLSVLIQSDLIKIDSSIFSESVTLVLQELRFDGREPLTLRAELSKSNLLPMSKVTFEIPAGNVNPKENKMVFWVRLFTKASVYLTFRAGVPIATGQADSVWKSLGYSALVKEGETPQTPADTEQLLFRCPLQLQSSKPDSTVALEDVENTYYNNNVVAFLHISDRLISRNVSLVVISECLDNQSNKRESRVLPRNQGNLIKLTPSEININNNTLLIGRIFALNDSTIIPGFQWKLTILSKIPLVDPVSAITLPAVEKRFEGCYFPNNKLILFKDIYTVQKQAQPIALKLSLSPVTTEQEKQVAVASEIDIAESTSLIIRLMRKTDRKVIQELKGRSLIPGYSIPLGGFLADGESLPSADVALTSSKDAKATKAPPPKKGAPIVADTLDILIECSLDENAMAVPPTWRSKLPHTFDVKTSKMNNEVSLEQNSLPNFKWRLDILAGVITNVSHDTFDLERYNTMKNLWEEKSEGRSEQALAAAEAYTNRKKLRDIELSIVQTEDTSEFNNKSISALASALLKDEEMMKSRAAILENSPKYTEYRDVECLDGSYYIVTSEDLEQGRIQHEELKAALESDSKALVDKFTFYNGQLKAIVSTRIEDILETCLNNSKSIAPLWEERESYRLLADKQNGSIQYLLNKGNEAIQAAIDKELEADGGQKKAVKGKKK